MMFRMFIAFVLSRGDTDLYFITINTYVIGTTSRDLYKKKKHLGGVSGYQLRLLRNLSFILCTCSNVHVNNPVVMV